MSGPEERVHARIHVRTQIDVTTSDGRVEAELCDLSKGGARFEVPAAIARVGDTVELSLPSLDKGSIGVTAEVIRHQPIENGHLYAVRFNDVEPSMQDALHDLLEVLLSTYDGGGRRKHPRVARRIEIRFGQLEDLRGVLEDISAGGLLMTVPQPLVLYEEVDVTVPDLAGGELLILHARVVNQRAVSVEGRTDYRVGLEFSNLRPEARSCLDALLRSVVTAIG